jgi:hypothetical protein
VAVAVVLSALALAGTAGPAGAHAGDAERATNYQTILTEVPPLPGLTVRLADAGSTIEVTYDGPGEVVVFGYGNDPEPYLRIGPDGVHRNRQSDATYVNDSLTADTPIPPDVDPDNPPEWERVSDEPTFRWHDHRAHWMGVVDPPGVAAARGEEHVVVEDWAIPITIDGEPAEIRGDVRWMPGPSPWPWALVITAGAAAVVALALLTRRGLAVSAGFLAGLGCSSVAVGYRFSPVDPPLWWLAASVAAVAALASAVVLLIGDRRRSGAVLAGVGGAGATVLFGVVDRHWLVRSLLPIDISPAAGRALVASCAAVGTGVTVAAAVSLLRDRRGVSLSRVGATVGAEALRAPPGADGPVGARPDPRAPRPAG